MTFLVLLAGQAHPGLPSFADNEQGAEGRDADLFNRIQPANFGLIGLVGALAGQAALHTGRPTLGLILLIPSVVLFLLAWRSEAIGLELRIRARSISVPRWGAPTTFLAIALLLGLVAAWQIDFHRPARAAWLMHGIAIASVLGAAFALDQTYRPRNLRLPRGRELFALLLIVAVAHRPARTRSRADPALERAWSYRRLQRVDLVRKTGR